MTPAKLTFEEVRFWLSEAKSCEDRQKAELIERNAYPYLIKYYEGNQYPDEGQRLTNKRLAMINEYFPNVNALIADIMFQNPDIIATATKPLTEQTFQSFNKAFPRENEIEPEMVMKSALTYAFKRLDALSENKLGLFDMIMAGYCAIEVNHINTPAIDTIPRTGNKEEKSLIGKIGDKVKKAVGIEGVEEEVEKTLPPTEIAYATPDETYLRRWNPLDVLLDYRADRIKDMRYTIKIIKMSYAEFNARYPEFKDKVQSSSNIDYSTQYLDKDKKMVKLFEFQVKQKNNMYVNFIISPTFKLREIDYFERPYTTNGFNLKIGVLNEYGVLYPVSRGKINKAIQDDINNYATFMMEVAERNVPKYGLDVNKKTANTLTALKSKNINDVVEIDGIPSNAIHPLMPTKVSNENKEMLALFDRQKDKLWAVSAQRLGEGGKAKFATELDIQEAGFQSMQAETQEGLRKVIREQLDTLKDIIVQFWDNPMFFKITGGNKPAWYIPEVAPDGTVLNPLTDILTEDYEIDVDISTALKPNRERKKKELMEFATWLLNVAGPYLEIKGYELDIETIKKVAREWGWNSETLIKEKPPMLPQGMQGGQGASMPPMPQVSA